VFKGVPWISADWFACVHNKGVKNIVQKSYIESVKRWEALSPLLGFCGTRHSGPQDYRADSRTSPFRAFWTSPLVHWSRGVRQRVKGG
jgi:hypothetical protein